MDAKKLSIIGIILLVLASAFFLFSPFDTNEEDNTDSTDLNTGFSGGSGTESDPYQISTCSELNDTRNNLSASYELVNDINFSECDSSYTTGSGWDPISGFEGTFDGNENTISDLYIDRETGVGLFKTIDSAEIRNLEVANAEIIGVEHSGIIVSSGGGRILNCVTSGSVTGSGTDNTGYGGIMGAQTTASEPYFLIKNCSSSANVSAEYDVGGVLGTFFSGFINNSYSVGSVESEYGNVGGLVGGSDGGEVYNSFWDTDTSGQDTSAGGGTGKTTSEMQDIDTFTDTSTAGLDEPWDMVLKSNHDGQESTAVWFIDDGNDYPRLFYEYEAGEDTTQKSNTISINSRLQLNDGRITLNG